MEYPRIAAAAVILDAKNRILLVRKVDDGSSEAGLWSLPSGKLHMGETLKACICRETFEETRVLPLKPRRLPVFTEDIDGPENHFVTFYFQSEHWEGIPTIGKPHKHAEVAWFEKYDLVWSVCGMAPDMPLQPSFRRFIGEGGLNYV